MMNHCKTSGAAIALSLLMSLGACNAMQRGGVFEQANNKNNSNNNNSGSNGDNDGPSVAANAGASTQDRGNPLDSRAQGNPLSPNRRPADGLGDESIPAILARTRNELRNEQERSRKAEEAYSTSQKQIEELQRSLRASNNELEAAKLERDRALGKIRDLQDRLVTAALRVVESERESLQSKILLEKAVKHAAMLGIVVDPNAEPAASKPAPVEGEVAGETGAQNSHKESHEPPADSHGADSAATSRPAEKDHK